MKASKRQRGMLLLWFLRGHVVLTLKHYSCSTNYGLGPHAYLSVTCNAGGKPAVDGSSTTKF